MKLKLKIVSTLVLLSLVIYQLSTVPAFAQTSDVLDVIMHFDAGKLSISSVGKRQGFAPDYLSQTTGYTLRVVDSKGTKINEVKFAPPQQIIVDFPTESTPEIGQTQTPANPKDITVTIPFPTNGQKLLVLSPDGHEVATYNLNVFKAVEQPETKKQAIPTSALAAAAAALILIAIAYIILEKRKKQPPQTTPPFPPNPDSLPPITTQTPPPRPQNQTVIMPRPPKI